MVVAGVLTTTVHLRRGYLHAYGPIRVRFLLPRRQTGRSQPLVVTGQTGHGTNIFVTYVDEHHVKLGADIWGTLLESPVLRAEYGQEQEVIVNASGLYPHDHPAVRALPPAVLAQAREDFVVTFNGTVALRARRLAYESAVAEVTVGETRIGGSLTQPKFVGRILAVDRLPVPRRFVVAGGERLAVRWQGDDEAGGRTQALFSLGDNGSEGAVVATSLGAGRQRLAQLDPAGAVVATGELPAPRRGPAAVEFSFARPAGAGGSLLRVTARRDGAILFGPAGDAGLTRPVAVDLGEALGAPRGVDALFTGRELAARVLGAPAPEAPLAGRGAVRLVVRFPTDRTGTAEPLLTTGRAGAGDFAFVTYVDATHAKFSLDHWGVGGAQSPGVELDYRVPHEVRVESGALWPPVAGGAAAAGGDPGRRWQRILLDGREVIAGEFPAYPTTAAEITPGRNRIGGSGCGAEFTGELVQAAAVAPSAPAAGPGG